MAMMLVSDELWAVVEPLLPPKSPKPKGGRPRINTRAVLAGILFVLKIREGFLSETELPVYPVLGNPRRRRRPSDASL